MNLAHAVETAVFVQLEGHVVPVGHTLRTVYDGHRLYVTASKGGRVVGTCWVRVEQLDDDPCQREA